MTVVVVDAANVVGSRPDGWWRDRAGAATRLLARLGALPGTTVPGPDGSLLRCTGVVAVVEGAAREAAAPEAVRVLRAPGSGDDALAALVADLVTEAVPVLVVTADRGLRDRLPDGAGVTGPSWLLAALDGMRTDPAG